MAHCSRGAIKRLGLRVSSLKNWETILKCAGKISYQRGDLEAYRNVSLVLGLDVYNFHVNATASTSAFAVATATPSAVVPTWTPGRASFIFPYLPSILLRHAWGCHDWKGVMVFTRDTSLDVGVDKVFDELSVNKFLKRRCTVKEYYDAFTSSFNNQGLDEGYLIDLFVFLVVYNRDIEERLKWSKPRSLSDAYSLAKLEETIHDLLKTKISSSSLHLSEAKDYSEVRNENFGLEGIDGVYEAAGKNREWIE
ncbi:hypothetical protein Tco_0180007 [Tanacetum coccineum]